MSEDRSMLLIGAGGFVGGHLLEAATAAGLRVITPPRLAAGRGGPACDLLDPGSIAACLERARPDLVVNLAGSASVAASWQDPAASFAVNATGVLNLLEAVAASSPEAHVVCVSSAQVYGQPREPGKPFGESAPLEPLTPYGASKVAMEALAGQYGRGRGLGVGVARLFNQVGPGQSPSQATAEFAREIAAAEAGGADRVELSVANPESARDFTDVRDAAAALLEISRRGLTGALNVCSGHAVALRSVIDLLAGMTPLEVEVGPGAVTGVQAGPSSSFGDPSRLREAAGWQPRIPLERSLGDLLEWWRGELGAA